MSDVFSESSDLIAAGDVGSPKRMKKKVYTLTLHNTILLPLESAALYGRCARPPGGRRSTAPREIFSALNLLFQVAARVSPNKREWILARVASIKANGKYEVCLPTQSCSRRD